MENDIMRRTIIICLVISITFIAAQTWETIGPPHGRIVKIQAVPNQPDTIFAVHESYSEPAMTMLRTFDGGETWDTLGNYNGFAFHPDAPETLLVAFGIGSFSDGILRSNNCGDTFDHTAVHWLYMAEGITYDRTDPNHVYGYARNICYSRDGGHSWDDVGGPGIATYYYGILPDPFANNNVWAWNEHGQLRQSMDFGATWITRGTFPEDYAPIDLAVSPIDTAYIYLANWNGISLSEDYGETWEHFEMSSPPTNCVEVSNYNPRSIVFGGAYGVCSSMDGGETWAFVGDSVEFEVLDIDIVELAGGGYRIFAGTAGNGIMVIDASPFSDGPLINDAWPPPNKWVSLDTIHPSIKIFDPDGVDESSIELIVDGITYSTSDPQLAFDDSILIFSSSFDDGDTVEIQLFAAEDALGNPSDMLPYEWAFFVDRSAPVATYVVPVPDDTIIAEPFIYKMHLIDEGAGLDIPSFVARFNSVTVYSSCISFLYEADTVLIDLTTAGLILEDGDTVDVSIHVEDSVDIGDHNVFEDEWSFYVIRSDIDEQSLPQKHALKVFPNPFNATCRIQSANDIHIYDSSGKLVLDKIVSGGTTIWNGTADNGRKLPSGVYLIKTTSGETARIILLR